MSSEDVKGAKTAKSTRANGHTSSGGHTGRTSPSMRQNSATSRANRSRWDNSPGSAGVEMQYQYQEYPKHLYLDPKNPKAFTVVNDADQERLALGGEEVINEEDERNRLLTLASVNSVQVDKRWGPAKLTKAIEDAGVDPTANPFK